MVDSREIVLSILLDIEKNNTFSNIAIGKALRQNQFEDKSSRSFITRMAEGVIEYKIKLDYIINLHSKTPINKCKPVIRCILRMGVYQIFFMDSVPDSAACNEAVKLAKKHGFSSLSGFINGVLRNVSRNKDKITYPSIDEDKAAYYSVKYSMPKWLCEKILSDYPEKGERIIESTLEDRYTTLRVNRLKCTKEALVDLIKEKSKVDVEIIDGAYNEKAIRINGFDFIRRLPGFREGFFAVQDESSMCSIDAANILPGMCVIDVCAAPGGKTSAAAENMNNEGEIYSMDISSDKLPLIEENLERLGITIANVNEADATILNEKFINKADVVIADLPCSGLGVIGRKNDIKYKLSKEQLDELVRIQKDILCIVNQYVKNGGTLLFSTCTINPDENQNNTKWFLEKYPEFSLKEERLFLQGIDECDGFYYAVMKKK